MQGMGGNAKFTGLVGRIRERIHAWKFRYPWIARLLWYSAHLVVVLGVCHWAFNYFNLYHTDADSARYMLSAMVQAQAAIIAIVITLTLIAVQLTASAYSPRVIRIFRDNPDMWLLLGFYGLSMLYGLVVLKMVEGGAGETVSQDVFWVLGYVPMSCECCVSVAYWLEAFTFVALFPYMLNIISLLESENIIKRLATKITKDRILKSKDDPIQPIMDIIHGAVMEYDIATTRVGLKAVTDRVIEIIDLDGEEEKEISRHVCDRFERVGGLAVLKMDGEATTEVIKNLEVFGKLTTKKRFEDVAKQIVRSLELIGKAAIEKELGDVTRRVAPSFELIGKAATEKRLVDVVKQVARSLESVGVVAAKKELGDVTRQSAEILGFVGRYAADERLGGATKQVVRSLESVGVVAAKKELGGATKQTAESLELIGDDATKEREEGLEGVVKQVARSLILVGTAAAEKLPDDAAKEVAERLARLTDSSKKIVESVIESIRSALGENDRKFFDKFMNLYEQQPEEPQTQY